MKEFNLKVIMNGSAIQTAMSHKGFSEEGYTVEQILTTIGILENVKQQMIKKLDDKILMGNK